MDEASPARAPLPRQSRVFFYLILATTLFLMWVLFEPFLIFTVAGVFIAVLALPIDRFWERFFPNRLAAFFTMFTILLILILPLAGLGFALANDAQRLAGAVQRGELQTWAEQQMENPVVQGLLDKIYPHDNATERNATVRGYVDQAETRATEWLLGFAARLVALLPRFFIGMVVVLFVVYYVLTDGNRLLLTLKRVTPLPARQVDQLVHEAKNGLHAVFVGQILTSLIQGALGGVGFLIAGLPGAVLWAGVMAVLSLLPVVGAFIVWIPATIILLAGGHYWQGIFLALWGFLVVSNIDNLLRPRLIGNRAKIHPLFVLIGVLGGVAAFGFIGLFLGPLLVAIFMSVLRVWESEYLDPTVGRADPTRLAEAAGEPPEGRPPTPPGESASDQAPGA